MPLTTQMHIWFRRSNLYRKLVFCCLLFTGRPRPLFTDNFDAVVIRFGYWCFRSAKSLFAPTQSEFQIYQFFPVRILAGTGLVPKLLFVDDHQCVPYEKRASPVRNRRESESTGQRKKETIYTPLFLPQTILVRRTTTPQALTEALKAKYIKQGLYKTKYSFGDWKPR